MVSVMAIKITVMAIKVTVKAIKISVRQVKVIEKNLRLARDSKVKVEELRVGISMQEMSMARRLFLPFLRERSSFSQ